MKDETVPGEDTVFVVDDDAAVRDALRIVFERDGYEVEEYDSAEAFFNGYKPGTPGCLVLDVRMAGMNGFSVQKQLPARGIDLPVIFLTAYGTLPAAVHAMERGAVTFLEKPVRNAEILQYVRNALTLYHVRHQATAGRRLAARKLALLTPRERDVALLVIKGVPNKVIARRLGVSHRTVEAHRARIRDKTGARSAAELTRLVLDAGRN